MKTEKRAYAVVIDDWDSMFNLSSVEGGKSPYNFRLALRAAGFAPGDQVEIHPRPKCGEVMWSRQPARPNGVCGNLQPCEAHPLSVDASEKPSEIRPRVAPGEESDLAGERLVALSWIDLTIGRLSGEGAPTQWVKQLQDARDIVARLLKGESLLSIEKDQRHRAAAPEGQEAPREGVCRGLGEPHEKSADCTGWHLPDEPPEEDIASAPEVPSAQNLVVGSDEAIGTADAPVANPLHEHRLCKPDDAGLVARTTAQSEVPSALPHFECPMLQEGFPVDGLSDCAVCGQPRSRHDRLNPTPRPALPEEVVCGFDHRPHVPDRHSMPDETIDCAYPRPAHPLARGATIQNEGPAGGTGHPLIDQGRDARKSTGSEPDADGAVGLPSLVNRPSTGKAD